MAAPMGTVARRAHVAEFVGIDRSGCPDFLEKLVHLDLEAIALPRQQLSRG